MFWDYIHFTAFKLKHVEFLPILRLFEMYRDTEQHNERIYLSILRFSPICPAIRLSRFD